MSSSFPSVPGFAGPLSLKAFLEEHFDLRLTFAAPPTSSSPRAVARADTPIGAGSCALRDVVLPPNRSFLLVVYVALNASSPPPAATANTPATPATAASSGNPSPEGLGRHRQPLAHQTVPATTHDGYVKHGDPVQRSSSTSLSFPSTGKSSNARTSWRSSASWLLYTNTSNRPFTDALLRHPWWASFAACMGPPAMGFIEMFCPIVLQLEAMAGGVQVLGPPLKNAASEALFSSMTHPTKRRSLTPRESARVVSRGAKRSVDRSGCLAPSPPRKKGRSETVEASLQAKVGRELQRGVIPSGGVCRDNPLGTPVNRSSMSTPWAAALTRTDAPRTRLYGVRVSDTDFFGVGSVPLPAGYLEAQWLRRHPQSLHRVLQSALPKRAAYGASRTLPYTVHPTEGATRSTSLENIPMRHVAYIFRWLVLRSPHDSEVASQASPPKFDLASHLCRVLSTVVDQCSRLDLRGAALKHVAYLEERCSRQRQGVLPGDVQRLATPVEVVVSYLRTLLSTLRWVPLKGAHELSFWGPDDASSERVLDALMKAVKGWLSAGRHAVVPVSRFLDGVPVAQVPWLNGFYSTNPSSPSSAAAAAAARHARRQRSQAQQRVWLQFALFFTQDILPFLIRASFVVTWSSKNTHTLIFFPARVWRQLVRQEVRRTQPRSATGLQVAPPLDTAHGLGAERCTSSSAPCTPGGAATAALVSPRPGASTAPAALSTPKVMWRAIRTCRALAHRGAHAILATRGGGASCLYAGVRFRPDRRKLRPIAVVRSASLLSLEEMARGSPSPYSYANAIVRLMHRLGWSDSDDQLPVATATLLRRVQARCRHIRGRGVHHFPHPLPAHLPHKAALQDALRCLVSGVEEKRVRDGLPRLSNLSHQDEYAELRSFCEEVRGRDTLSCNRFAGTASAASLEPLPSTSSCFASCLTPRALQTVTLVRSDATRCYDNLPQERVLAAVAALVKHDVYRVLHFTVIHAREGLSAGGGGCLLQRAFTTRTIPLADAERGVLARVPRGHIYWEEGEERRTHGRPHATATTSHGGIVSSRCGPNLISGAVVRALLREHVRHHLVVVSGGGLFEQRLGILQGSPVAMLLCDYLFADVVDTALSCILSEHEERSLLLRRVDDVLVATASPTAAERCLQAMQRGWPSVGYLSNPNKLMLSSARGSLVPWCGLLLHDTTLELSVEWRRIRALLASLRVGDPRYVQRGDREPLCFTQRFLSMLQLRVAPTVLCGRVNSKSRQLQTFYEIALLWSRVVLEKVQEALPVAHDRRVAVLLLRPLAVCVGRLLRLLGRHQRFLMARQSACAVSAAELRACVLTALHRTVQAKLRMLQARTLRVMIARRGPAQRGASLKRRPRRLCANRASSVGGKNSQQRRQGRKRPLNPSACLRSFWWMAAAEVESQWRRSLHALVREAPQADEARNSFDPSTAASALLLTEDGPTSMHMRALNATRLSQM
ncbi:hypothetical protein JKF63_00405 [Porcisia hertigi]|uniref:Telomerase reverse transcriptase n=1 Tax=Porcisia hertigi TaxID=2761500 RepID=A0A836I872_9TRYP|nr:hypothetical protein JKF63_00405 [Porcisia hertigi]